MMSRREVKAVLLYWLLQCHHRDSSVFVVHGLALHRPRSSALAYRNQETTAADQEGRRILSPVLSPSTPAVAFKNKSARANTRRKQPPQKYIVQKQERHDGTTKFLSTSTKLLGPVDPEKPAQQRNEGNDKYYWNVLGQEVARAMMVVAMAALVWPASSVFSLTADVLAPRLVQEVLAAIATAVPLICLLPVSHGAWRIRQDAVVRLYGAGREADNDQQAKNNVMIAMAPIALARAVQEEVFFRLLLCGVVGAMTGSPWFALGLGSLVYGSSSLSLRRRPERLDEPTIRLDRWVEGLWYSGLFVTGTVGIPGLILAHGLVQWHEDATCWQHVVTQLRYVEAKTAAGLEYDTVAATDATDAAAATATTTRGAANDAAPSSSSSSTSDLHRFFLAHDSRHCGKLNAHDMRRALEYASPGRNGRVISRRLLESVELYEEYDFVAFEAKLRALHKEGVLS